MEIEEENAIKVQVEEEKEVVEADVEVEVVVEETSRVSMTTESTLMVVDDHQKTLAWFKMKSKRFQLVIVAKILTI